MARSPRPRATSRALRHRPIRLVAGLALASVLVTGTIVGHAPAPAWAVEYPSWDDVQNARQSEAAKKIEVAQVQSLLAGLQADVDSTQTTARQKGDLYQKAQQKFDEADFTATQLQNQADSAQITAAKSRTQAGQLAAQLARSNGHDLSTKLFFGGNQASELLAQLGLANLVKSQSAGVYAKAVQDQNTAQSLTDQADLARAALKILADGARTALAEATDAALTAASAFDAQQQNSARLAAQLATMITDTQHTEDEYAAGVAAQWGDEAGLGAGKISATGWARPSGGHISSVFGYRINPYTRDYAFHSGTDLAANCNSPIFAAHGGTVAYAGWNGGYGNFVLIDNGDGTSTGYGHIVDGGLRVTIGQRVGVGQPIALVGSTGHSTGCHLHYEVRQNGVAIDPVTFMRGQGIELAN